jgi:hypothetical protein
MNKQKIELKKILIKYDGIESRLHDGPGIIALNFIHPPTEDIRVALHETVKELGHNLNWKAKLIEEFKNHCGLSPSDDVDFIYLPENMILMTLDERCQNWYIDIKNINVLMLWE